MIYISIDPGMSGAVAVINEENIEIFNTPLKKEDGDNDYDIKAMSDILKKHQNEDVICMIEAVFSMNSQGVVSVFNFGRGKGLWEGIAHCCNFKVFMVSPQTWKKYYPELIMHTKIDKALPKKEQDKLKRLKKAEAKTKARELASKLYPSLSDRFKKVKDDGPAESLLMALYIKNQHIEGKLQDKQ